MSLPLSQPRSTSATALGLLAILFWSAGIAFTRRVTESFGVFDGVAITTFAGGLLGCAWLAATGRLRQALAMPRAYHLVCGGLIAAYFLCYSQAIGQAVDRQRVLEVGIVNYLWPGLTLLFSLPILGRRASPLLFPGILLAFAGAVLSIGQGADFSWSAFGSHLLSGTRVHLLALLGAVIWGLYSNLSERLAAGAEGEAVPLHLVAAGLVLFAARLATGAHAAWHPTGASWACLAVSIVFPTLLSYLFWDIAMRRGHAVAVVSASYATPLLSTVSSACVLGVRPGPGIWSACALVIAGALLCKFALRDHPA